MASRDDYPACALKLYEALTSGKGLQGIVDIAVEIFDNPVLVADASFKVLAHAERPDMDDKFWLDIIKKGFYPADYVSSVIKNDALHRQVSGVGVPELLSDGVSPNKYLSKFVVVDERAVGFATCLEFDRTLSEFDSALFKTFCEIVGVELRRNELLAHNYKRKQDFFISEMISGPVKEDFLNERLRQVELRFKSCNFILVAEFSDMKVKHENQIAYFRNALEQLIPDSYCIRYFNSLVTLITRDNPNLLSNGFSGALQEHLETTDMVCGISHYFRNIAEMSIHYKQTKEALRLGRRLRPGKRIFEYSRLVFFHMADIAGKTEDLRAFCNPKLSEIIEYDLTYGTKYAQTAYDYLRFDRNPSRTAEHLNIHRNTIDYRIKRIEELFGVNLGSQETAFSFGFSYKIFEYLGTLPFDVNDAGKALDG